MRVSAEDRARVNAAIAAAEANTSVDFVCVLVRAASNYEFYPLAWSVLVALALPWPLLWLTGLPFSSILLSQLIGFALAFLVLSAPPIRRIIVPRSVQRAAAHRAATEQFFIRGLANTPERRGVLLFVAYEEHYARVLADEGAATVIRAEAWQTAINLLVAEARQGRHADGFVTALAHCGDVARQACPIDGTRSNALPDRFFVLG